MLKASHIPEPRPYPPGGLLANRIDSPAELLAGLNNDGMVTLKEALDIPEGRPGAVKRLREHIAPAFGLADPTRITRVLNSMGYVLSNDFAIKLLILNERRRVNANVILCGDTGVGKSEVFSLYSTVVNADSDIIPDLLGELKAALKKTVQVRFQCCQAFLHVQLAVNFPPCHRSTFLANRRLAQ